MSYKEEEEIKRIARDAVNFGLRAFISGSKTHGFIALPDGSKIVSFQLDLSGVNWRWDRLWTNYQPWMNDISYPYANDAHTVPTNTTKGNYHAR